MNIGIFGSPKDDQVRILKQRIEEKGKKATVIYFRDFPANVNMHFTGKNITLDDTNLLDMHAFYIRQLGYFWPVPQIELTKSQWMDYYQRYNDLLVNERENLSFKHSMIRMLDQEKLVVNPYDSFVFHRMKPYQFYLFHKHGLPVPDFAAGSASAIINSFELADKVAKPLGGGAEVLMARDWIAENEQALQTRAILFQEYIQGDNIRAFVVEDAFIGAARLIHGPQVDSRVEQKALEQIQLPDHVKETCFRAMELLDMKFSGIDFMRTPDGDYYILECNPSPMFYVFEQVSSIPVSSELAEYLIRHGY